MQNKIALGSLCAVAAFAAVMTPPAQANLLLNGNLDQTQPVEIVPGFFLPKPAVWTNVGTRAITGPYEDEMSSEPWAGPAPTPVTADGSDLPAPDGCDGPDCAVFFKGFSGNAQNGAATGHLYQDVPATPGQNYTLTGWAGAEANFLAQGAVFALDFLDAGGGVLSTSELDLLAAGLQTPNGQPFSYKQYMVAGVAPAGATTVRARVSMLAGEPNPSGGGQAFVVDDFVLVVPEPAMAAALAVTLVAVVGRRRR